MTTAVNVLGELNSLFHDLEERVRNADYSETLEKFQLTIASQEAEMFAGQHDSSGTSCAPQMTLTVKCKGHSTSLFETGALNESLVHVGSPDSINATSARNMPFGTGAEDAIFHQDGTTMLRARLPDGLSEETLDNLCNTIADTAVEILTRG